MSVSSQRFRATAVEELARHLAKPSRLEDVASLLAGAIWLADAAVEKIEVMGGEALIAIPAHGSGFVIRFPASSALDEPSRGVYLALDGDIAAMDLRDVLMSKDHDPTLGRIRIVDFAFFPDPGRAEAR